MSFPLYLYFDLYIMPTYFFTTDTYVVPIIYHVTNTFI
jgi:hypothetical protein